MSSVEVLGIGVRKKSMENVQRNVILIPPLVALFQSLHAQLLF